MKGRLRAIDLDRKRVSLMVGNKELVLTLGPHSELVAARYSDDEGGFPSGEKTSATYDVDTKVLVTLDMNAKRRPRA